MHSSPPLKQSDPAKPSTGPARGQHVVSTDLCCRNPKIEHPMALGYAGVHAFVMIIDLDYRIKKETYLEHCREMPYCFIVETTADEHVRDRCEDRQTDECQGRTKGAASDCTLGWRAWQLQGWDQSENQKGAGPLGSPRPPPVRASQPRSSSCGDEAPGKQAGFLSPHSPGAAHLHTLAALVATHLHVQYRHSLSSPRCLCDVPCLHARELGTARALCTAWARDFTPRTQRNASGIRSCAGCDLTAHSPQGPRAALDWGPTRQQAPPHVFQALPETQPQHSQDSQEGRTVLI